MLDWRHLLFSGVFRHTAVAFVDRLLLSITHFAIGILLLRHAQAADYGLYVLAQSALLLAFFVQSALITIPMTVLAPKYATDDKRRFVSTLAQGQYLLWLPLCVVVAVTALLLNRYWGLASDSTHMILIVDIVLLAVLMREFIRCAFFVYLRPDMVLYIDAVYGGLTIAAAYMATAMSATPALHTLMGIGLANLVSGLAGWILFHRYVGWHLTWQTTALSRVLAHGKWALLGVSVTWLQSEGFLYLLGALKGTSAVASVSASRLLLMPIIILTTSFESIVKPRGAAWLVTGEQHKLEQSLIWLTVGALAISALYMVGIMWSGERLAAMVFHTQFSDMRLLLGLWGAVLLCKICSTNLNILLQILERFDVLFYIALVSAAISLTFGYVTIQHYGAPGSLYGLIVVEVIGIAAMGLWLYRHPQLRYDTAADQRVSSLFKA